MVDTRVTYRRRKSYNTRSNRIRKVKTPGSRITVQYYRKNSNARKCPITGQQLTGIPVLRPYQYKFLKRRERTVSRAYGGNLSGLAVRDKIIRAFLIEEVKIVKRVMAQKTKQ
eukprot:TRINITY_DN512_c0_g1_i1.p1 TRINITY_DN512_c0_g1~~TRINITY_DN512_c0_g1_i1.p1  ORF type:complete len:113 (+),score=15.44 TRINITY_DN512_c0_g1_i1:19-357(+)